VTFLTKSVIFLGVFIPILLKTVGLALGAFSGHVFDLDDNVFPAFSLFSRKKDLVFGGTVLTRNVDPRDLVVVKQRVDMKRKTTTVTIEIHGFFAPL
jgi:hypothetical protein